MTDQDKSFLLNEFGKLIRDWNSSWNNGRNEAISEAMKIVDNMPVDDNLTKFKITENESN